MDTVCFTVNGERYTLNGSEVSPSTSLNDYLRGHLGLLGTKAMCHEGGCGACVVSVAHSHPATNQKQVVAVNSCLVHVLSCHEWDITTIEGVGNGRDGYSPFQTSLAKFNGTQCGYCSPGWVMNMYSLYKGHNKNLTKKQIERSFGGNMCRCTGYRPILEAFKTFATDAETPIVDQIIDLEDVHEVKCGFKCIDDIGDDWCVISNEEKLMDIGAGTSRWYKAYTIQDIFKVLLKENTEDYILVAGNTGKGVYPTASEPRVHIDISSVKALKRCMKDENLVVGAGTSMSEVMQVFQLHVRTDEFSYLQQFYDHLDLVAHVPVRNIGTIGGNLALKNSHHEFPSDIFLLLATVRAIVTIVDSTLENVEVATREFLKHDVKNKLILNVKLPSLSKNNLIRTYKIMPRAQNAHAIVNAGFLFHVDASRKIIFSNVIFGHINPDFIHAKQTEDILKGHDLFSGETLRKALLKLEEELVPLEMPPEPSAYCRKSIALGLFYKAILSLNPPMNDRYKSGGSLLERAVSRASQTFDTDKSVWPLNQPVPKLEGLSQCAGEARYACDVTSSPRLAHVAFVLSSICLGDIESIDPSNALKIPGVLAFYSAKDIPGKNCFTPTDLPGQEYEEEIFATKTISYYGQPVGIVAAVTRKLAIRAAGLVTVTYKESKIKPVLTVQDVLVAPDKDKRIREETNIKPTARGTDIAHVIMGNLFVPDQYHYTMETQSCVASLTSRGLSVRAATQWMDTTQEAVAGMLSLPLNSVQVRVARVGGAYGGKASRAALPACACALAALRLRRAAALAMPLADNMAAIGKRPACYSEYEVGVNNEGLIQYMDLIFYSDCGYSYNDTSGSDIANALTNLYESSRWSVKGYSVLTDKASNTWCRAPSTTEATAIVEVIMERIAYTTNKDPVAVRILNFIPKHSPLKDMIDTFKTDTDYDNRKYEIAKFNNENAWKKKSLKISVMSYPIIYWGNFSVTISIYHSDGTVLLSHGGIEMGQGINTKVAQVCAYTLGIPLDMVTVKGSDTFISPNAMATSASITSECVAYATIKACKELLERLKEVKSKMNEPTWQEVVKAAFEKGINLQASSMTSKLDGLVGYDVYGVCAAEVILDVLTGTHQLLRVDILEDTGRSLSPELDVGQIEGAFIMGVGLWTSERLVLSARGRLLTDRTWSYKPPGALDIPADFRVAFRRNASNTAGVLRSKATGEPALVLAVVVTFALHETILEARKEHGYKEGWIDVGTPYCVENIVKAISPKIESYKLM